MKTKEIISAIVAYHTLPPQIDYTFSWKIKADKAQKFLNQLPKKEQDTINAEIENKISKYYGPDGAAQYDALF